MSSHESNNKTKEKVQNQVNDLSDSSELDTSRTEKEIINDLYEFDINDNVTFDESESRIIFLYMILYGTLVLFIFTFMAIIHYLTFKPFPVIMQPNIQRSTLKGLYYDLNLEVIYI